MSFETRKFRDIEVIVNITDPERPINLTKLAASLTKQRLAFKELARRNHSFWDIVDSYTVFETDVSSGNSAVLGHEDSVGAFALTENNDSESKEYSVRAKALTEKRSLQELFDKGVLVLINGGSDKQAFGTYGPTWLADWIVINCCPRFFRQIHELFDLVEQAASLKNRTFEREMDATLTTKDIEIKRLLDDNNDLREQVKELAEQNDYLVNLNERILGELHETKATVDKTYREFHTAKTHLDITREDISALQQTALTVSNQLRNVNSTNHSTGSIEFRLYFFTSAQIPRSEAIRRNIKNDEVWIGCACGEVDNIARTMPNDANVIFERVVNSRDQYDFIKQNCSNFIVRSNYRHLLIKARNLEPFLNEVDRLMNLEANHESIRNLETVYRQIRARKLEAEENRLRDEEQAKAERLKQQLLKRKDELVKRFGDALYIRVAGYRRKVDLENWTIRYGRGGTQTRSLNRHEILEGDFGNKGDKRITYE